MTDTAFASRLREFFYYPKLSRESDEVEVASFEQAMFGRATESTPPTSLYIHVPFCNYLCHFCGFYKELNQAHSEETRQRYTDAVRAEVRRYARSGLFDTRGKLEYVEFGGGTPTTLTGDQLASIIDTVAGEFEIRSGATITMEGDAITLGDTAKLRQLRAHGLNRVSFGVQTLHEPLRRKLGLKPSVDDVMAAVASIRAAGLDEYATDIMYNLPDQDLDLLLSDADRILALEPDYVDAYSLTLWENTTFKDRVDHGRGFDTRPTNDLNLEMFGALKRLMTDRGLRLSRSYTFTQNRDYDYIQASRRLIASGGNMIGVGASSRGYVNGAHYTNVSSIADYISALEDGRLPIDIARPYDESEHAHRIMVLFPSMLLEIEKAVVPDFEQFRPTVDRLKRLGLLWEDESQLGVTDAGHAWAGNISREFLSQAQHKVMTTSFMYALRHRLNPYNQDSAGVPKGRLRTATEPSR
jgi:oxygen-independent coproporphyrinogen-3 oxidase